MLKSTSTLCLFLTCGLLSGCGISHLRAAKDSAPVFIPPHLGRVPDAKPKVEAHSKYGNPSSYVVRGKRYYVRQDSQGYDEKGIASWYGTKFHGQRTSSGEPYNMYTMTAAHKSLPLPTYARVTNLQNGRQIVVKINDRGPFEKNRIIDLSYVAAKKLDMLKHGTAMVEVKAINPGEREGTPTVDRHIARHPNNRLFVQVGAYSSLANAKSINRRVKSAATPYPIHVYRSYQHGVPVYKVQIGPLDSVETSDKVVNRLGNEGFSSAWTLVR
ncbi:MAG: hypothetical protein DHS20C10_12740 [marine bacterium B5-7]|nr:MAG: hypothetical protein DHS20C10_12740 [marine bacterium B5-7]